MIVQFREPEPQDVERIAVSMRHADMVECSAALHTPWQGLNRAVRQSVYCWTGEVDGWPEAMFGVVPGNFVGGLGHPWFLGSEKARWAHKLFLRDAAVFLKRIELVFPRLEGMVWSENTAAIRWLQRLGFVVDERLDFVNSVPMRRFHKGF